MSGWLQMAVLYLLTASASGSPASEMTEVSVRHLSTEARLRSSDKSDMVNTPVRKAFCPELVHRMGSHRLHKNKNTFFFIQSYQWEQMSCHPAEYRLQICWNIFADFSSHWVWSFLPSCFATRAEILCKICNYHKNVQTKAAPHTAWLEMFWPWSNLIYDTWFKKYNLYKRNNKIKQNVALSSSTECYVRCFCF